MNCINKVEKDIDKALVNALKQSYPRKEDLLKYVYMDQ